MEFILPIRPLADAVDPTQDMDSSFSSPESASSAAALFDGIPEIQLADLPITSFPCPHHGCSRSFPTRRGLAGHERTKHADAVMASKPFKCMFCGGGFSRASSLKKHIERCAKTVDESHAGMDADAVMGGADVPNEPPVLPDLPSEVRNSVGYAPDAMPDATPDAMPDAEWNGLPEPIPAMFGPYTLQDQVMMLQAQNQLLTEQLNRFLDYFMHR